MQPATIVWFRTDLRLGDNQALHAAVQRGGPVVPVFIWAPDEEAPWAPGAASRWWLHQSLASLRDSLAAAGGELVLARGPTIDVLRAVVRAAGADAVYWTRRYEPAVIARDARVAATLRADGIDARAFSGSLLFEPGDVMNASGNPFQVFTPFWRACLAAGEPGRPLPAPRRVLPPRARVASVPLDALALEPAIDWAHGMREAWQPGSAGAAKELRRFLRTGLADYAEQRNLPGVVGTSRLSPHLHFGEISPRQVWAAVEKHAQQRSRSGGAWRRSQFIAELGWREFAHHLLVHFPHTTDAPLRPAFSRFPWRRSARLLRAWQQGRTGIPMVDAGMRELWSTGWMHNRVRMIVASFLVKNLLVTWQEGARWFWDTLVDADLASNTLGWQWTAGCGADAAPYFRVFNPAGQGEKFDAHGAYVRRWVPEVAALPDRWVHQPSEAPGDVLAAAAVTLGRDYPRAIVSLRASREAALAAYTAMRTRGPR